MRLAINALRAKSGGAISHLKGILNNINPSDYGIAEIHVWSYQNLLNELPNNKYIKKHNPVILKYHFIIQLLWEYFYFHKILKKYHCDFLFNVDAGKINRNFPNVTLSQDMLPFEWDQIIKFGFTKGFLRLVILRYIHKRSLSSSDAIIFLTLYASKTIQNHLNHTKLSSIIPHGVNDLFFNVSVNLDFDKNKEINCVYVSQIDYYKHQWNVVEAIYMLRCKGYDIKLNLIGGNFNKIRRFRKSIQKFDPNNVFVNMYDFTNQENLVNYLKNNNIFIFASSCENLPITLLEGMACGFPIVSSNNGPMPEILGDAGLYFNPENPIQIAEKVEIVIKNQAIRKNIAGKAKIRAKQYGWGNSSNLTFTYIKSIYVAKYGL
jgi:glycosyltransferase involved in cell wall biosynthesis